MSCRVVIVVVSLALWLPGCGGSGSSRRAKTTAVTTPRSELVAVSPDRLGPVAEGFRPVSASLLNDQDWWLLGERPCSREACLAIVRTTDGGRRFVALPAPAIRYEPAGCPYLNVSALTFADPRNGYAYGCRLYVTHDGGTRWRAINLRGFVIDLAAGNDEAYAIVSANGFAHRLVRSSTSGDSWVTVPTGGNPVSVTVRGSTVFVGMDTGQLLISHDRGGAFSRDNAGGSPCVIQPVTARVVWAFCSGGMMGHVMRSTNGGHSFSLAEGGTEGAGASGEYHAAVLAAASATTADVGFQGRLLRSTDGGRSYQPVGPRGQEWTFLAFTDATHGVALAGPPYMTPPADHLYVTTDAGQSFTLVPIR